MSSSSRRQSGALGDLERRRSGRRRGRRFSQLQYPQPVGRLQLLRHLGGAVAGAVVATTTSKLSGSAVCSASESRQRRSISRRLWLATIDAELGGRGRGHRRLLGARVAVPPLPRRPPPAAPPRRRGCGGARRTRGRGGRARGAARRRRAGRRSRRRSPPASSAIAKGGSAPKPAKPSAPRLVVTTALPARHRLQHLHPHAAAAAHRRDHDRGRLQVGLACWARRRSPRPRRRPGRAPRGGGALPTIRSRAPGWRARTAGMISRGQPARRVAVGQVGEGAGEEDRVRAARGAGSAGGGQDHPVGVDADPRGAAPGRGRAIASASPSLKTWSRSKRPQARGRKASQRRQSRAPQRAAAAARAGARRPATGWPGRGSPRAR